MGIQINGNTNNINAGIGSLSIEDLREIDIVGVATASNFKTGSSNLHSTGLTVGNALVHSTGINVGTGATVHSPATNILTLGTNSNEIIRITSDGVIGINDNNPGAGKKVKIVVANNSSYQMVANLTNNVNADINFYIKTNESLIAPSTNTPLCLGSGGAEKLRIASTGNVGINQTSPQRILHVGESGTAEANIRIQGGSDYGEIRVKDSDNELSFHHNVGGAGSRELFSSNGSTGHFSINCYSYQALTITTNENGTNGPEIQLMHNSASPAANDTIGQIRYSGKDSAGDTTLFSKIETKATTVTNGTETGHIDFSTRGGGAYNSMFRLSARGTASAPSYTTDDMNGIILDTYNTGNPYPRYFNFIAKAAGNTDSNIGFWTEAVGGSPTQKMTIDASGTITKPLHPVFATRINYVNSYVSSGTKVQMKAAHIDTRSGFSDANDRYVAPAAGRYLFYFFSNIDYNGDGTIAVIFKKNGSDFTSSEGGHIYSYAQNSGWHGLCGQIITNMAVNDYIEVFTSANNMKVDGNSYGQFGGYMIG